MSPAAAALCVATGVVIGGVALWRAHRWWTRRDPEAMDDPVITFRESGLL